MSGLLSGMVFLAFSSTGLSAPITGGGVPSDTVTAGFCEATLVGTPLRLPAYPGATQRRLDQDIAIAREALRIAPDREDSYIWLGRRLGYAGRICEAIDVFTRGLSAFPNSYKLRRFRARHLARARQFDLSLKDYREGLALMEGVTDSFEPDGLPNPIGLTIGTFKGNFVYYHAQTSFATGDYQAVIDGMKRALELAPNFSRDDMLVPTAYWTYLAHRKMGQHDQARLAIDAVPPGLKLIENATYYKAVQLMQGRITPAAVKDEKDSTIAFALAMERRFSGDDEDATRILRQIVADNPQGHWPSEVELTRPKRSIN